MSEDEARNALRRAHNEHDYLMCPHTAVAMALAEKLAQTARVPPTVVLGTAHPLKFVATLAKILPSAKLEAHHSLRDELKAQESDHAIDVDQHDGAACTEAVRQAIREMMK